MANDVGCLFMSLFAIYISFSVKCLFMYFAHFLIRLMFSSYCWVLRVIYILHTKTLLNTWFANISSPSVADLFILQRSLAEQKFSISLCRSDSSIFPFMDHAFGIKSENSLSTSRSQRFFFFSHKDFMVVLHLKSGCILSNFCIRCEVHFIFAYGGQFL